MEFSIVYNREKCTYKMCSLNKKSDEYSIESNDLDTCINKMKSIVNDELKRLEFAEAKSWLNENLILINTVGNLWKLSKEGKETVALIKEGFIFNFNGLDRFPEIITNLEHLKIIIEIYNKEKIDL